ncbi:MAG: aromatic ring-opening dioxygenase LigA [Actinomycetota bacterium]
MKSVAVRRLASIGSIVLGALLVLGGIGTWFLVSTTLGNQKITTSDDACLPGRNVSGPFTAYCEAKVIEKHTLEASDGLHYAELERDDPRRESALTASFLQSSLFTSVVAFGLSAMAAAIGVLFVLIGLGMRDVEKRTG